MRYLRGALADALADAPCGRIGRALGGELAEELEEVMGALRSATPRIQQAAPGVLQGAAAGFLAGGPVGAVVGGALGAVGAAGSRAPSAAPSGSTSSVANPAALELLLTVLRPEIVEALVALALGRLGARSVPVAGVNVPVATAANLVQSLAEQAVAAHTEPVALRTPRYLSEAYARGEDIGSPAVRAESLRTLLRESEPDLGDDDGEAEDEPNQAAEMLDLVDVIRLGEYWP